MSQGQHPLYKKGEDSYSDYLNKLRSIAKNDSSDKNEYLKWKFSHNFSE